MHFFQKTYRSKEKNAYLCSVISSQVLFDLLKQNVTDNCNKLFGDSGKTHKFTCLSYRH